MRWCNVQTKEYELQAKTYPTIWTHHKLPHNNENKFPDFPEYIYTISDRIWCNKHLKHTTTENLITLGKVDASDNDDNMSYRYILSIT